MKKKNQKKNLEAQEMKILKTKQKRMKNEIKAGTIIGYINMIVSLVVSLLYTPILLSKLGQSKK